MKRFLMCGLLVVFCSFSATPAMASAPTVTLDGQQLYFDVAPVIEGGRTLVPLGVIFRELGAHVEWDGITNTVNAMKSQTVISLRIGDSIAHKNGQPVALDVPAKIINSRTMVPLAFVSEAMGAQVSWDQSSQTVSIFSNKTGTNSDIVSNTVINYDDGSQYVGEVKNGAPHGSGTLLMSNGDKYDGQFENNEFHGNGTYKWMDGDEYVGQWKNGSRTGQGTYTWPNGRVYSGDFVDGVMQGYGIMKEPGGAIYKGQMANDCANGQGTVTLPGGESYSGSFRDDNLDGYGTITLPNGTKVSGLWENGELISNNYVPAPNYIPDIPIDVVPDYYVPDPSALNKAALESKIKAIESQYNYDLTVLNRKNKEEVSALIDDLISRGFSGYPQIHVDQVNAKYDSLRRQLLEQKNRDIDALGYW